MWEGAIGVRRGASLPSAEIPAILENNLRVSLRSTRTIHSSDVLAVDWDGNSGRPEASVLEPRYILTRRFL